MYKLYQIIYRTNPQGYIAAHAYYVATSKQDVKDNSQYYNKFCGYLKINPFGTIEIKEITDLDSFIHFYDAENLNDFEIIPLSIKKKEVE